MGGLPAPALAGVEGVDSLAAQGFGQLFEGAFLFASQEQDAGAVADDGFSMIFIDRLQLALGLHHDMGGNLAGADHADEVLKVGDFLVGELIQQAGDVGFQRPAVLQGLVAQHIEHLRIDHGRDEIEGHVRVGHDAEQGRLAVPDLVQLQFIPLHQLPNLFDVERGHTCSATYQDGFCGFSRCHLIFSVLTDGKVVRVLLLQTVKHEVHGVFIILILLPHLGGVEHIQQGGHVHLLLRGLIPDIGDQRLIVQGLGLRPEIFGTFAVLAFGVLHDAVHQLQNVVFTADIFEGVVAHGLLEVDGVEYLDLISAALQHIATFFQDGAFSLNLSRRLCGNSKKF